MCFFETDAIAGISGGTEIKYIDTQTGVNVSGYGNILGAVPLWNYSNNIQLVLTSLNGSIKFMSADINGSAYASSYPIRVFYY